MAKVKQNMMSQMCQLLSLEQSSQPNIDLTSDGHNCSALKRLILDRCRFTATKAPGGVPQLVPTFGLD